MHYHKVNGLKQHEFSVLQFCRSKAWQGTHQAKIKVFAGTYSYQYALVGSTPLPFPASRGYPPSLTYSPFVSSEPARTSQVFLTLHHSGLLSCSSLLLLRTTVINWAYLHNESSGPYLKVYTFNHVCKVPFAI